MLFKMKKYESESCSVMYDSLWPHGLYSPWNSPSQNTGVGSLSLLQGIFLTQGSNPGLRHCRQILYQLSHKGSPRMLEWVAFPFSSRSSQPRNWIGSPALQADSAELLGKPTTFFLKEWKKASHAKVLQRLMRVEFVRVLSRHPVQGLLGFLLRNLIFILKAVGRY